MKYKKVLVVVVSALSVVLGAYALYTEAWLTFAACVAWFMYSSHVIHHMGYAKKRVALHLLLLTSLTLIAHKLLENV